MMKQVNLGVQQQSTQLLVGDLDTPTLTMLGSLDDDQKTGELDIKSQNPKPFLAIIYTGI